MPSAIPYLDETWNPITGCTPISPGCDRCWARAMDRRFRGGEHGPEVHATRLSQPAHWRKPRRVGVCFLSDLWHPAVRPEWRRLVMLTARAYTRHTFLLLTKRAAEMAYDVHTSPAPPWETMDHVWLGVTVEDQFRAYDRMYHLVNARVTHRWVSVEPLLGPLDFKLGLPRIGWVVVGCESGPGARPCPTEWVESVVEQCRAASVPVYVKQIRDGRRVVKDPAQFPPHLRLRQYPEGWV